MKTQNFFGLIVNWTNIDHKIDRSLLQSILQELFQSNLKGRELANSINDMNIMSVDILDLRILSPQLDGGQEWWKSSFAITKINKLS